MQGNLRVIKDKRSLSHRLLFAEIKFYERENERDADYQTEINTEKDI